MPGLVEPLGDVTYVYFELGDETCTASVEGDIVVEEGDEVTLVFPRNRVHIFDATTGEALKNREKPTDAVGVRTDN